MVFRPDTYEPSILLMWADFAYFLALFSVPLFGGWCVLIALPIFFSEPGREPFPRWVAYVNLWAALLLHRANGYIFQGWAIFLAWHCCHVPALHCFLCMDSHHVLGDDQNRP